MLTKPSLVYRPSDIKFGGLESAAATIASLGLTAPRSREVEDAARLPWEPCGTGGAMGRGAGGEGWVYSVMTDKRDVNERLRKLLSDIGLRVAVLRSDVDTKDREAWIAENGPKLDVCISHPKLVQTGLDFYAQNRSYYFPTLWLLYTGTITFVARQASRRAWSVVPWAD